MFDFHADRRKYFDMSVSNTETYLIPFIENVFPITAGMRVLEIGCGEGGVLKDTIEHIPDQSRLLAFPKKLLVPDGVIFFGFPPWQMPFGGHQQMCRNKWLSVLPYYHLLPRRLYKSILAHYRGPVTDLLEIRDTRLSIEDFKRIVRKNGYTIVHKLHYLINPIYEWKFGWKPRPQLPVIRKLPYLRNFVTSCVYYLITS